MAGKPVQVWAELDDGGELPGEHHGGRLVAVANTRPGPVRVVAVVLGEDRCTMLEVPRLAAIAALGSAAEVAAALETWQPSRAWIPVSAGRVAWFDLTGWPLIFPAGGGLEWGRAGS